MKVRLGFGQTSDEGFLVLAEPSRRFPSDVQASLAFATYDHEDIFLCQIVEADFSDSDLRNLVVAVLLSIAQPIYPARWVEVDLDGPQWETLGFTVQDSEAQFNSLPEESAPAPESLFGFTAQPSQIAEMLLRAPTPFTVLSGPEHRMVFVNSSYLRIMGYEQAEEILGKTIREILPELEGQPFFRLLDTVYRTGTPYVGREVKAMLRSPDRADMEEAYFDFVYHPMRDEADQITGIWVQATDVTIAVIARTVTENREELLYSQWAELDAIYRNSPAGMSLIDAESSRILNINQRQAELMGSTVEDLLGKSLVEVSTKLPEFLNLVRLVTVHKSIRNTVVQGGYGLDRPNGKSWLVNMTPGLDAAGGLKTISSIFMEIPRALMAESGLEASNDLVSDVLDNMTDGLYVLDREWNFVYLNSRARAVLHDRGDLLGRNIWQEYPAAADLLYWEKFHLTMEQQVSTSFVAFYPEPLSIWSEVQTYPARNGIAVFFHDITEEKQKQEKLRESEERYRMMLDLNPQVPFTMSATGMMTDISIRWTEMTGQSRDAALGRGFMSVVSPSDILRVTAELGVAVAAGSAFDFTWRARSENGGFCWMRTRGTPVLAEDGTVLRWYGTTEDIDELMRLRQQES